MTFTYSFEFTYLSITLVFWTKNIVYKKENINQLHSAQFEIYWGKDFCGSAKQDNWKVSSLSPPILSSCCLVLTIRCCLKNWNVISLAITSLGIQGISIFNGDCSKLCTKTASFRFNSDCLEIVEILIDGSNTTRQLSAKFMIFQFFWQHLPYYTYSHWKGFESICCFC